MGLAVLVQSIEIVSQILDFAPSNSAVCYIIQQNGLRLIVEAASGEQHTTQTQQIRRPAALGCCGSPWHQPMPTCTSTPASATDGQHGAAPL